MKNLVLVFLRFPEPGRVKTRLAGVVGAAEAAEIYRRLVAGVFRNLGGLNDVTIRVLFDPPARETEVIAWISGLFEGGRADGLLEFAPQAAGELGERLRVSFEAGFADGFEAVAAVGTDCVDLSAATFDRTWAMLEAASPDGKDVVFGPCADGGYYLVAMKRVHGALFEGIPWSSRATLAASLRAAAAAGLRVGLLEELRDVDELEDWVAVARRLEEGR